MSLNIGSQRVQKENERERKKNFFGKIMTFIVISKINIFPQKQNSLISGILLILFIYFFVIPKFTTFLWQVSLWPCCKCFVDDTFESNCFVIAKWFSSQVFLFSLALFLRSEMRPQFFAIQFHYSRFVLCLRWLSHSRYMPDVLHFNYFEKS